MGRRALAVLVAAAASVAACTSSGAPSVSTPPPPTAPSPTAPPTPTSSSPVPTTNAPSPTAVSSPPSSHTHTRTRTPSTTPLPSNVSTATTAQSTCRDVGLRVIPGGASPGQELAALQFTNDDTAPCVLTGYPTVVLRLHGKPIGQPSHPAQSVPHSITLKAGATAESRLHDITNCQAPLSDTARITIPGTSRSLVHPLVMRACTLIVDPLGPPS